MLILRRLFSILPTLVGAATLVFVLVRAIPGDPAVVLAGEHASPEKIAEIRTKWGLDRPILAQYGTFLGRLAGGDLGQSTQSGVPVRSEIGWRFGATFELAVAAIAWALLIGVPLGLLGALRPGSARDAAVNALALIGVSIPIFGIAYAAIFLKVSAGIPWIAFSDRTQMIGPEHWSTPFFFLESLFEGDGPALNETARHLFLPSLVLSTVPMAVIARVTRSAVTEILRQPYLQAARAKGVPPLRLVLRHVLRNAAVPISTAAGVQVGYLLGGAVLTETVFAWPGIGQYFVQAVGARDYPAIQGVVVIFCLAFVLTNTLVDALYPWFDPRLRRKA